MMRRKKHVNERNEQERLFREAARRELAAGRIDRREFLTRSLVTGLGRPASALSPDRASSRLSPPTAVR